MQEYKTLKKLGFLAVALALALMASTPVLEAQEEVEIIFSHIFPDSRDVRGQFLEEIAAEFEAANPGVTVTIQPFDSYDAVYNNALLAAEQGNPPHIVQVEDTFVQNAIDSGFFTPISDLATPEQLEAAELDNILQPVRDYYGVDDDVIWAMPWNISNPILYYNNDLLTAAGVDTPPTTFDEILTACEAIMATHDLNGCINWPVSAWFVEQWVAMQGGLLVDMENGRTGRATEALLTSPEMTAVFEWLSEMAELGYFTYTGNPNADTAEGALFVLTQGTAMTIASTAGLTNFINFSDGRFELGVAPLPLPNPEARNGVTVGGGALWITSDHSEAELQAALDFVLYLTSPDIDPLWHQASGYMPMRMSSVESLTLEGWFDDNPFFTIALNQLRNTQSMPATAGARLGAYTEVRAVITDALQAVIDNGENPADALSAAKVRADEAIATWNLLFAE